MGVLENLILEDRSFSEAKFKAKVDNVFIQLYAGVMKQDLQKVRHFLSDDVYEKFSKRIIAKQDKGQVQIYDELNVSGTNIINISEFDDRFEIEVSLLSKYLDYVIDKSTRKFISGNRNIRTEKRVRLVFSKIKNAKTLGLARSCNACGANMDLNRSGKCEYCGTIYELKEYDWVLKSIED